jgi:hypothetical protein
VGNGQARADANVHAERAKSFFKGAAKVLAGIVLAPVALAVGVAVGGAVLATRAVLQIPRLINEKLLEPGSDKQVRGGQPPDARASCASPCPAAWPPTRP